MELPYQPPTVWAWRFPHLPLAPEWEILHYLVPELDRALTVRQTSQRVGSPLDPGFLAQWQWLVARSEFLRPLLRVPSPN